MDTPLTRRSFCQMALAVACCEAVPAAAAPLLRAEFGARIVANVLRVDLVLYNPGDAPVDVLLEKGRGSAIDVECQFGSTLLKSEAPANLEPITRAGPRLVWGPLPAGGKLAIGSYALPLPKSARPAKASFSVQLETRQGTVHLQTDGVPIKPAL